MCSKCVAVYDLSDDFQQCEKRVHKFRQDPVAKFIDYLRPSRPFADKVYVISHYFVATTHSLFLESFLNWDGPLNW